MKKFIYLGFFSFLLTSFVSKNEVNWLSFEDADKTAQQNNKPILVFIGTSWCKYCNLMQATTLKNDSVIQLLNQKVNPVYLNAESKEDIRFRGKVFRFSPKEKTHELALQIGKGENGKLVFPTTVIINGNNEIIFQEQNLIEPEGMIRLLKEL